MLLLKATSNFKINYMLEVIKCIIERLSVEEQSDGYKEKVTKRNR